MIELMVMVTSHNVLMKNPLSALLHSNLSASSWLQNFLDCLMLLKKVLRNSLVWPYRKEIVHKIFKMCQSLAESFNLPLKSFTRYLRQKKCSKSHHFDPRISTLIANNPEEKHLKVYRKSMNF